MESAPASQGSVRPKGLFILSPARLGECYDSTARREIEARIEILFPPQAELSETSARALLLEVEIIFSGPGMRKLDEAFLAAAPRLKAIFHAGAGIGELVTTASEKRGLRIFTAEDAGSKGEGWSTRILAAELNRYLAGAPEKRATLAAHVAELGCKQTADRKVAALVFGAPSAEILENVESPREESAPRAPFEVPPGDPPPPRKWWRNPGFLIVSVAVHLLFFAAATYYVVSIYTPARRVTFQSAPAGPAKSQPRAQEHKVKVQNRLKSVGAPPAMHRITTTGLSKIALPEMPMMPSLSNPSRAQMQGVAGVGLSAGSGAGGGAGAPMGAGGLGAGRGAGPPISFFGIRDAAQSVVIMIDVSDSMFTRTGDAEGRKLVREGAQQSFQVIRDEVETLIKALPANTRFGIVRWSGGAYSWKPELVVATPENKEASLVHLRAEVDMKTAPPKKGRPGGTRHDYALEEAFSLKPEVIYMLTDGNATAAQPGGGLSPIDEKEIWEAAATGQKTLSKPARLHVIYYITGADKEIERKMLARLASRNGGKFRDVEAKGRKK